MLARARKAPVRSLQLARIVLALAAGSPSRGSPTTWACASIPSGPARAVRRRRQHVPERPRLVRSATAVRGHRQAEAAGPQSRT